MSEEALEKLSEETLQVVRKGGVERSLGVIRFLGPVELLGM